ncbi:MAG: type IV pilin protein [Ramlibacter sp.]|nr:type IV pilin protein [Ramlibacter sp.]
MISRQKGFTLIELMIAVAVVGILAAVAYPSYQNAMVKNRRAAAQSVLADVAQRQQLFLTDNRAYASALSNLNVTVSSDVSKYYTVSLNVGTSTVPSFTVTAAPVSGSSQVADGTLTLTHNGTKSPAGKW